MPVPRGRLYNVVADNWTNGKYCLGTHVPSLREAERNATLLRKKYEGKQRSDGKYYRCHNFRAVEVIGDDDQD